MPNEQNLKPIRSKNEARERGKNGGLKSGEVRRERKLLKDELLLLLSTGKTQEKISLALIEKALNGEIKAFETIRDTIGEKPTDKQEIYNENFGLPKIFVRNVDLINPSNLLNSIRTNRHAEIYYIDKDEEKEIDEHIQQVIGY